MSWLGRLFGSDGRERGAELDVEAALDPGDVFVCTTCGRSDLPEAGDWDPPICRECDAAINFDAILESEAFHDR